VLLLGGSETTVGVFSATISDQLFVLSPNAFGSEAGGAEEVAILTGVFNSSLKSEDSTTTKESSDSYEASLVDMSSERFKILVINEV
jgi:hypothetical protein